MLTYLIRRVIGLVPVFFGITLVSFFVIHLAPGKPTDLDTSLNPRVSYEARLRWEHIEGLDRPLHIQYLRWLGDFLRLDFGRSQIDDRRVSEKVMERLPITLFINILSIVLILGVGIPLGVISAVKRQSLIDRVTTIFVFIGFSTPEFWLALLLMGLFGINLGWLPISGIRSFDFESLSLSGKILDIARHLVLPVFISAFGSLAGVSRYMRTSMISTIQQDYIRTARAKGLKEPEVIYRHALKNAILPIITILGLSVPGLVGGSVIFESIFAIPGMGKLFYDSVMARDFNVIMGILVIGAVLTLMGNFIADLAYSYADPRIRVSGE